MNVWTRSFFKLFRFRQALIPFSILRMLYRCSDGSEYHYADVYVSFIRIARIQTNC